MPRPAQQVVDDDIPAEESCSSEGTDGGDDVLADEGGGEMASDAEGALPRAHKEDGCYLRLSLFKGCTSMSGLRCAWMVCVMSCTAVMPPYLHDMVGTVVHPM